jgi:hypothetical protein
MWVRSAVALLTIVAALPAVPAAAEPLNAEAARHFVAGKLFSFTCFEGSTGSGRIFYDGSVIGMVRMQGAGPVRFMRLPAGSLFPKGGAICSQVKGAFFNPCFDLNKTSANSFRGAISGFGFAYCDFTRGGRGESIQAAIKADTTTTGSTTTPAARSSIRRGRKAEPEAKSAASKPGETKPADNKPVAAPTQPVTSAPLPSAEQAGIRSTITP